LDLDASHYAAVFQVEVYGFAYVAFCAVGVEVVSAVSFIHFIVGPGGFVYVLFLGVSFGFSCWVCRLVISMFSLFIDADIK
jgi:hypothetical protein